MELALAKDMPKVTFDDESSMPLWVQLRDRMAYLISSGYYLPGEKLPTVRKFAADLRIAYNTVSKAYMGLERDGYVTSVRGSGVVVNEQAAKDDAPNPLDAMIDDFVQGCLDAGMEFDDIPKAVSQSIRRVKREHGEK